MGASTHHEGSQAFMNRALHFAIREVNERPRVVSVPATWLGFYLAYRAGVSLGAIAELAEMPTKYIARRIRVTMGLRDLPAVRERIEALVTEMGRVRFDERDMEPFRFPHPLHLAHQRVVEAVPCSS
jgi:hypothetical protein